MSASSLKWGPVHAQRLREGRDNSLVMTINPMEGVGHAGEIFPPKKDLKFMDFRSILLPTGADRYYSGFRHEFLPDFLLKNFIWSTCIS
jgi:hypothetical protein